MANTPRPPRKPKAVAEAESNATIPSRPVIQHTKLLRAELQAKRSGANDALAVVDHELQTHAGIRDAAIETADRAYELAMEAAHNAREGAHVLAKERFNAIRAEKDEERADLIRTLDGIEAALAATAPAKPEAKSNVEPIRQPIEVAA